MFGGYDGNNCYNDIEVFDTDAKIWARLNVSGNIPCARNAHSITVVGKNLFLYGGHSGNKHLKDLYIFNSEINEWSEPNFFGSAPEGLRGHTATYIGNKIIIFGGYDGKGRSNQLYLLNLENMNWEHVLDNDKFPGSRQRHSAIPINIGKIIIFGGFDGTKWLNDLHILDVAILMENISQKESSMKFQDDMKMLINNKDFSDICFKLENGDLFYAHKSIFAGRSEFFLEKFKEIEANNNNNNNKSNRIKNKYEKDIEVEKEKEKEIDIIELFEINFETFNKIAEYIYTGKIDNFNFQSFNILDVLIWSNFFKLKELKEFCENSLIFGINIDNVIEILISAFKYNFLDLKTYAVNFIMNNFHEVNSNKSFFLLEAYPQLMMEIMILSMNKIERD